MTLNGDDIFHTYGPIIEIVKCYKNGNYLKAMKNEISHMTNDI